MAIVLLRKLGFSVAALTGKASEANYLKGLDAETIIDRAEMSEKGRPLQKERWAGVVDAVGSHTLANACAQIRYGGAVAACGLAQGFDLPVTVMPFILRGVSLLGIDSVNAPRATRLKAYERLARDLDPASRDSIAQTIGLRDVIDTAAKFMSGEEKGRYIVDVNA